MLLTEILNDIPVKLITGNPDISDISYDTRTVKKDSIFVCIKGINSDRHDFYKQAIEKGAACIVSEYPILDCTAINVVVENTNRALALISSNFYNNPERGLRIIGVTGTNGKTTTTNLIKNILEECGYKVGLIGTNEIIIGEEIFNSNCTTPEAPQLFSIFSQMKKASCDFVIMEVSSHSIALERIYGITFDAGIFTNLTQDHLDFHKNMDKYAETKAEFFKNCKISVINADDKYADRMKEKSGDKLVTYGINSEEADYAAINIEYTDTGVNYTVVGASDDYNIKFPIPGKFSVYNSLSVCALANELTIPDGFVRMALKKTGTVKGRCEIVETEGKPYTVIIDYAHTPDGMVNIISTVNEFKKSRLITLFGCGGDRDKGKRPQMGKIAKDLSDIVIVTSDNPRSEDADAIISDITAGILDMEKVYTISDRREAIKFAAEIAEENDIILLLGKGHETVQKFGDYEVHFDEREVVKALCD